MSSLLAQRRRRHDCARTVVQRSTARSRPEGLLVKFATITVLGPPVPAVLIFEVLLNATAMFNHGNIRLPRGLDRVLRGFVADCGVA